MFVFHGELVDYSFVKAQQRNSDHCVLFLHGWGGNKNSFYSTKNLLSAKYNCLTITLPTTAPTNLVWRMEDYVDCVENLLANLNIKKISIVCHSFGFRIATLLNYKITKNNKNLQIEKIVVKKIIFLKKSIKITIFACLKKKKINFYLKN